MSIAYIGTAGTGGIRVGLLADHIEYVDDRSNVEFLPGKEAIELRFALVLFGGCRPSSEDVWTDGGREELRPMLPV